MGISREPRPSEQEMNRLWYEFRNLDKCVWSGNKGLTENVEEHVEAIKNGLDKVLEEFKKEV